MLCLDLTLPTPEENLACDEVLLDWREENGGEDILRFWEPQEYSGVLGYTNKVRTELDVPACEAENIPYFRRYSGGGTVLHGPGSLCYAVILDIRDNDSLANITCTNCYVIQKLRDAISPFMDVPVEVHGYTDLTYKGRKFSGNAQRRKKNHTLFHGTFLLAFDLPQISRFLRFPSIAPGYRAGRSHEDFLTNIGLQTDVLKSSLARAWETTETIPHEDLPLERIKQVASEKYLDPEWIHKF